MTRQITCPIINPGKKDFSRSLASLRKSELVVPPRIAKMNAAIPDITNEIVNEARKKPKSVADA
jgi:hypothetical protein